VQLEPAIGAAGARQLKDRPTARSNWRPNIVVRLNGDKIVWWKKGNKDSRLMTQSTAA
jgi:hypothetical protein